MLHLENSALQEVLEVAIDPPMTLQSPSDKVNLTTNQIFSSASTDINFNWKTLSDSKLEAIAKNMKSNDFLIMVSNLKNFAQHSMQKVGKRKRCILCTSNKLESKTNNMCIECNMHLCYVNGRNCFRLYHS